jgi:pyrimidine precursor biosynthesis enzyme
MRNGIFRATKVNRMADGNRHATPYHAPVYLAQKLGYFGHEGIKVALLEPNDPSDVTEIIGSGKVDMGFKAMIHTLAAKARGFPVTSIGSLLDEPFTGVVYLKDSGITTDFRSLKGKKIGYVGEFGKVCVHLPFFTYLNKRKC